MDEAMQHQDSKRQDMQSGCGFADNWLPQPFDGAESLHMRGVVIPSCMCQRGEPGIGAVPVLSGANATVLCLVGALSTRDGSGHQCPH